MTDPKTDPDTPASPDSRPSKAHGDALLDGSGSRHGAAPTESVLDGDDDDGGDEKP